MATTKQQLNSDKKWLTVQIAPSHAVKLDEYAVKHQITKTEVVKRYLDNLDKFDFLLGLIENIGIEQLTKLSHKTKKHESYTSS
jgi:uncharacterized protein YutD